MDSLDPNQIDDPNELAIGRQCMRGLVEYDNRTAEIRPAVAERWLSDASATVFTFTLRDDAKFANGEPVDAEAFVRGWSSATRKSAASPDAYLFAGVKGFADQQAGRTKTLDGVEALDRRTLQVTLSTPDAEFAVRTGHLAFSPRPFDASVAARAPTYGEFPICDGPFMFKEPWKHDESVTLVRNPDYYGPSPFLAAVVYRIYPSVDAAYAAFQTGDLDWTRVPPSKFREAKKLAKFAIVKTTGKINYLSMNVRAEPFDNVDVRRAISLALDRQVISQAAFAGLNRPATAIVPPVVPGSRDADAPCKYCTFDVSRARAELDKARRAGVDVTATIDLCFETGAGHEVWMQAVAGQLEQNLGLKTHLRAFKSADALERFIRSKDAKGLIRGAFGMNEPTPDDFLAPLFGSASPDNTFGYHSTKLDDLISEAHSATDGRDRLALYQQAEDVVLSDLPVIPMWWGAQFRLAHKDRFGGLEMNAFEEPTVETAFLSS